MNMFARQSKGQCFYERLVYGPEDPANRLARVTPFGGVTFVPDADLESVRSQYQEQHRDITGVDRLREKIDLDVSM